jgi:hypothetical protein
MKLQDNQHFRCAKASIEASRICILFKNDF